MNTSQEERHTSDKLVVKVAEENPEITKLIPAFEEGIKKQKLINIEVEKIRTLQEMDNSGVTEIKKFTMDNLAHTTIDVAGAAYSYADSIKDTVLKGLVNYKRTSIAHMTPGQIISAANTVCAEAKKIPPAELTRQGISPAELTEYEDMVTYFKTVSESPRQTIIDKSAYTIRLVELFKESRELYKNTLDRLAHQFIRKNLEFYVKYHAARKAIHRGPNNPDTPEGPGKA